MQNIRSVVFRALLIAGVSVLLAVAVNASRPTPVTWLAQAEYEIFEDCDETTETSESISLAEIEKHPDWYLVVDARDESLYAEGHIDGAYSLPYDPLFSVDAEQVEALRSAAGDKSVVVVGDDGTARLLADDLLSQGLAWVQFLDEETDWRRLMASGDD